MSGVWSEAVRGKSTERIGVGRGGISGGTGILVVASSYPTCCKVSGEEDVFLRCDPRDLPISHIMLGVGKERV
jgi:hypothetical protein